MIVVSNSSPLICLARIGRLDLLRTLFEHIHLAEEVWQEVVVRGAGRPAAQAVPCASWIEVHPAIPATELLRRRGLYPLGAGELATVRLAQSLPADLALLDERAARRLARASGVAVMGCVGLLETAFRRGFLPDLRASYQRLLAEGIWIDTRLLNRSLAACDLPSL